MHWSLRKTSNPKKSKDPLIPLRHQADLGDRGAGGALVPPKALWQRHVESAWMAAD